MRGRKPSPVGLRVCDVPVTKSKGNQAQRRAGRFHALTLDGTVWREDGTKTKEAEEINTATSDAPPQAQSGSGLATRSGFGLVPRDALPPVCPLAGDEFDQILEEFRAKDSEEERKNKEVVRRPPPRGIRR